MGTKYLRTSLLILTISLITLVPQFESARGGGGGRRTGSGGSTWGSRSSSRPSPSRPSYGLSPSHPAPSSGWTVPKPAPSPSRPSYPSPSHPSPSYPSPSHPSPSYPSPSHQAPSAGWAVPKKPSPAHPSPSNPLSHPSPSSSHPSPSNNAPGIGWKNPSHGEQKVDAKNVGSSQSHKPSAPPPEVTGWNPGVSKVTGNNPSKNTDHINKQTATGTQNAPGIGWAVPKPGSAKPSNPSANPSKPGSPTGWIQPKSLASNPSSASSNPSSSHANSGKTTQGDKKVDAKNVGNSKPSAPPPEVSGWNPSVNKVTANSPSKKTEQPVNKQTAAGSQNAPGIGWAVPKPGSAKPSNPSANPSKTGSPTGWTQPKSPASNPSSASSNPSSSHANSGKNTQGDKKVDAKNVGNSKPSAPPPEVSGWNPSVNKVTANSPSKKTEQPVNKQTAAGSQNVPPGQYPYHPPAYPQQPGGYPGYPAAGGGHYPAYPGGHYPSYPGGYHPGGYNPGGYHPGGYNPGGHYPGHGGTTIINQNINYNSYHRPNYNPPSVFFPSYSYSSHDYGSGTLGFFLGYSLAKLTTPTYRYYGQPSSYDPYRPTYDHYTVHHYYHNKETVVKQTEVQPNAIVTCVGDSGTVCPAGTYALCTTSGSIMCVASAASVQPCANDQQVNCIKSTVPCVNSTTPECKGKQDHETATVSIPCIYDTKVIGKLQYVNNTIVLDQPPPPPPTPPSNVTANPMTTLAPMYQNMSITTIDPLTTTPSGEPERNKRDVAQPQQQFCVTIVAEPAQRKQLSEGEEVFKNAKNIFQKFAVKTLGVE